MSATCTLLLPSDESFWESGDGRTEGIDAHQQLTAVLAGPSHDVEVRPVLARDAA